MGDRLFVLMQYLLPKHLISRLVGMLAHSSIPVIKDPFIRAFIKHFKVNMAEAERQNPTDYDSFNDFFTRSLKLDASSKTPGLPSRWCHQPDWKNNWSKPISGQGP